MIIRLLKFINHLFIKRARQQSGSEHTAQERICWPGDFEMKEIIKVDFLLVLAVRIAELIKKVCFTKWEKEWAEMGESQRSRYNYILENYNGLIKKKII